MMQPAIPPVQQTQNDSRAADDLGILLKIISFLFPMVGALLYFAQRNNRPAAAKQACTFAWAGILTGLVFNVIYFIISSLTR